MASVDAINSQLSFGRSHKKIEKSKAEKPSLVSRAKEAYVKTINKKYEVDYDSLDLKSKRTLDKDFLTEKTLCAGLSLLSMALLIKKGRTMLNGIASAAGASLKNIAHKPVDNMISAESQGLSKWVGNKLTTVVNAPSASKLNNTINNGVSQIINKQNDTIKNGYHAIDDTVEALSKLLSDYKYDNVEINLENVQTLLKKMGQKGGNGSATEILSLKYLEQIEKLNTEKVDIREFTEKLVAELNETLANNKKSFSVTSKTMNRMADDIERVGNKDLATAIRSLIPEKIADDEVFSVSNGDFNTIVANNKMTVFEKIKPGKVDQDSKLHKFLSKIFKKEDSLEAVEDALGKQGITDGGKLLETGTAASIAITSGDGIYETIDEITDINDADMKKLAEDRDKLEGFKDVVKGTNGKINAHQLKQLVNLAADVAPAFFDAA